MQIHDKRFTRKGYECSYQVHYLPAIGEYTTGYVKLPEDHPDFGVDYSELIDDYPIELSFSGVLDGDDWWLGFDTGFPHVDHSYARTKELIEELVKAVDERAVPRVLSVLN